MLMQHLGVEYSKIAFIWKMITKENNQEVFSIDVTCIMSSTETQQNLLNFRDLAVFYKFDNWYFEK